MEEQTQKKYNMFDLFWLVDPNHFNKEFTYPTNMAHFTILSFNINFGNLRIVFYELPQNAVYNSTVFHDKLRLLSVGTIYPAACLRIIEPLKNNEPEAFICMEQLIKYGDDWEKERPILHIKKEIDKTTVNITSSDRQTTHYFEFTNYSKTALEHACNFVINNGFNLRGQNVLSSS